MVQYVSSISQVLPHSSFKNFAEKVLLFLISDRERRGEKRGRVGRERNEGLEKGKEGKRREKNKKEKRKE